MRIQGIFPFRRTHRYYKGAGARRGDLVGHLYFFLKVPIAVTGDDLLPVFLCIGIHHLGNLFPGAGKIRYFFSAASSQVCHDVDTANPLGQPAVKKPGSPYNGCHRR